MTLQQLLYFCEISKHMNFSKAAEIIHISQPSLSNAIQRLENELGFLLFERKGRHLNLTKYGKYFYQQITPVLEQIDFVTEKAKIMAQSDTGYIDLAYNAPFGKKLVPYLARKFLNRPKNKNCTFHFHQASSENMVKGLLLGQFDVGICSMTPLNPELEYVPILKQRLIGIVSAKHELSKLKNVTLSELLKFPYVDYSEEVGIRSMIHKFFDEEHLVPQIVATAPDEESIAALVAEDFGVSFIAEIDALKSFDIARLKINQENCYRMVYMACSKNNYLTPAVKRFIEYIKSVTSCNGFNISHAES